MPLQTPYGVLSGSVASADLVNPTGGQWPHYHVHVNTPDGLYDSAINLKSLTSVQIEYRVLDGIDPGPFTVALSKPDGWTHLTQDAVSGALDYARHPGLQQPIGWILQTGQNLIQAMQYLLTGTTRISIFGAAYNPGQKGVHDVHMNQGDPPGSEFAQLDAIWQDGGVIFQYDGPQPHIAVLQIKFETQTMRTDSQGHPRPRPLPHHFYFIPRRHWPPGDPGPLKKHHKVLAKHGLSAMALRAAAALTLPHAEQVKAATDLTAELQQLLPDASADEIREIAAYLPKLGVAGALARP